MSEELFEKYATNRLSREEQGRLADLLESDPEAREAFARFLAEWEVMGDVARQISASSQELRFPRGTFEPRPDTRRASLIRRRAAPRRRNLVVAASAAAGILIILGLVLLFSGGPRKPRPTAEKPRKKPVPEKTTPRSEEPEVAPRKRAPEESPAPPSEPEIAKEPPPPPPAPEPVVPEEKTAAVPEEKKTPPEEEPTAAAPEEPEGKKEEPEAPGKTKTKEIFLSIARLQGKAQSRDGKRWVALRAEGISGATPFRWEQKRTLRFRSIGELTLAGGERVAVQKGSELHVVAGDPVTLRLEKGAVFCTVPPAKEKAAKPRFVIETEAGRAVVTGTQFGVALRSGKMEVVVTEGAVTCVNDRGEAGVKAGFGTTIRSTSAPRKPREDDPDRLFAWRHKLKPPVTILYRCDFEDGKGSAEWETGKVEAGPARGANRRCISVPAKGAAPARNQVRPSNAPFEYHESMRLKFRYHTGAK
ncbi:MAG: FecR family protein, partial [Planctomycetota bacterium]